MTVQKLGVSDKASRLPMVRGQQTRVGQGRGL